MPQHNMGIMRTVFFAPAVIGDPLLFSRNVEDIAHLRSWSELSTGQITIDQNAPVAEVSDQAARVTFSD